MALSPPHLTPWLARGGRQTQGAAGLGEGEAPRVWRPRNWGGVRSSPRGAAPLFLFSFPLLFGLLFFPLLPSLPGNPSLTHSPRFASLPGLPLTSPLISAGFPDCLAPRPRARAGHVGTEQGKRGSSPLKSVGYAGGRPPIPVLELKFLRGPKPSFHLSACLHREHGRTQNAPSGQMCRKKRGHPVLSWCRVASVVSGSWQPYGL